MNHAEGRPVHAKQQKGACLHLLLRASTRAFETCRAACGPGDSVVFMGTGVTLLVNPGIQPLRDFPSRVFVHSADLKAHGLAQSAESGDFTEIDDLQLADLVCRHDHCLSWK